METATPTPEPVSPASTPVDVPTATPTPVETAVPTPAPTVTVTAVPVDSGPQTYAIDQGQFDAFMVVGVLIALVVGFTIVTRT